MGRSPKEDARIEHRRAQVRELSLTACTQASIAGELRVSQATISSDLKALRREWSESRIRNLDEVRDEQLRKSSGRLREAWKGWQRSQEPAETTRIFQKDGEQILEKTVRQQSGDPRFLQAVQREIEAIYKLRRLNAVAASTVNEQEVLAKAIPLCVGFIQGMFTSDGLFASSEDSDVIDDEYIYRHIADSAREEAAAKGELEAFDYEKYMEELRANHDTKNDADPST